MFNLLHSDNNVLDLKIIINILYDIDKISLFNAQLIISTTNYYNDIQKEWNTLNCQEYLIRINNFFSNNLVGNDFDYPILSFG